MIRSDATTKGVQITQKIHRGHIEDCWGEMIHNLNQKAPKHLALFAKNIFIDNGSFILHRHLQPIPLPHSWIPPTPPPTAPWSRQQVPQAQEDCPCFSVSHPSIRRYQNWLCHGQPVLHKWKTSISRSSWYHNAYFCHLPCNILQTHQSRLFTKRLVLNVMCTLVRKS